MTCMNFADVFSSNAEICKPLKITANNTLEEQFITNKASSPLFATKVDLEAGAVSAEREFNLTDISSLFETSNSYCKIISVTLLEQHGTAGEIEWSHTDVLSWDPVSQKARFKLSKVFNETNVYVKVKTLGDHIAIAKLPIAVLPNTPDCELNPVSTTDTSISLELSVDANNMTHSYNATQLFSMVNKSINKSLKCSIQTYKLYSSANLTDAADSSIAKIDGATGNITISKRVERDPILVFVHAQTPEGVSAVARLLITIHKRSCGYETIIKNQTVKSLDFSIGKVDSFKQINFTNMISFKSNTTDCPVS